jgi:hypothetical protein
MCYSREINCFLRNLTSYQSVKTFDIESVQNTVFLEFDTKHRSLGSHTYVPLCQRMTVDGFGLRTGFIGPFVTTGDYTLQFTITHTHTSVDSDVSIAVTW